MTPPILEFTGAYRFLSNFYYASVMLDGIWYPTVENAYQAAKTLNNELRAQFRKCGPGTAKKLGQTLQLQDGWEDIKLEIMEVLVRQKFKHTDLATKLLATKDAELVEGNYWNDKFWGVCRGEGLNHLGKILMKVRAELRNTPILF